MSESPAQSPAPPAFEAVYVCHGRGPIGDTGHIHSNALGRTLCNVEKRTPWLDVAPVDLDDPNALPMAPKTLDEWIANGANARYLCGTCVRLYRRACQRF